MKGEVATVPGSLETPVSAEQTQRRRNSTPPVGMRVKIELICPGGEWFPKACASRAPTSVLQRVRSDAQQLIALCYIDDDNLGSLAAL